MNDATVKKVEMLESKPDYIMEATRVGSFDNEMYNDINKPGESVYIDGYLCSPQLDRFWESLDEQIEKQIADSHDITKSNFGFKP